ncbi:MAG: hypothetical protein ABMB14_33425, partial [Myxococcota bacterium]
MFLFSVSVARAADPVLMPLSTDPVVGDHLARVGAVGAAGSDGGLEASGLAELAVASRVAVGATIGATDGEGSRQVVYAGSIRALRKTPVALQYDYGTSTGGTVV